MWSSAVMRFNRQLGRTDVKRAKGLQLKKTSWERRAERLMAASFCTEDYLLGAVSGAARGSELFTEEDRPGAVSGAARGCEPLYSSRPCGSRGRSAPQLR